MELIHGIQKTEGVGRRGVEQMKGMPGWNVLDRHLDSSSSTRPAGRQKTRPPPGKAGADLGFLEGDPVLEAQSSRFGVRGPMQNPGRVGRRYIQDNRQEGGSVSTAGSSWSGLSGLICVAATGDMRACRSRGTCRPAPRIGKYATPLVTSHAPFVSWIHASQCVPHLIHCRCRIQLWLGVPPKAAARNAN